MNRQAIDLGFILKQLPDCEYFSMSDFSSRLKLQKTIYLLQIFGVYLGYDFHWYLRGPYCSMLMANGYQLESIYNNIPNEKTKFQNADIQKKFENFLQFITGKDIDDLEIAASLHSLKQVNSDKTDEHIMQRIINKRDNFDQTMVKKMWEELKKWKLI